jgi:hypothetical protein
MHKEKGPGHNQSIHPSHKTKIPLTKNNQAKDKASHMHQIFQDPKNTRLLQPCHANLLLVRIIRAHAKPLTSKPLAISRLQDAPELSPKVPTRLHRT